MMATPKSTQHVWEAVEGAVCPLCPLPIEYCVSRNMYRHHSRVREREFIGIHGSLERWAAVCHGNAEVFVADMKASLAGRASAMAAAREAVAANSRDYRTFGAYFK